MAEESIISKVQNLLQLASLLEALKLYAAKRAHRFIGYRKITIRLKSGKSWKISSPVCKRQTNRIYR